MDCEQANRRYFHLWNTRILVQIVRDYLVNRAPAD